MTIKSVIVALRPDEVDALLKLLVRRGLFSEAGLSVDDRAALQGIYDTLVDFPRGGQ